MTKEDYVDKFIKYRPNRILNELVQGQSFVISYLFDHDMTITELSKAINVSTARMAVIINSLEKEGKVIRQSVAADTEVKEGTTIDIVISNGPETKTYKGTVTGTISTADETLIATNVTVTVYVNDTDGYHQVYTVTQAGSTFEINGYAEGLNYNNGTVSFTVVDAEGNDVSGMYSKSLTLSYENE